MNSSVVRVPNDIHQQAKQVAALRGQQPGEVLAEAWRKYMTENREQFAADLEEAARLLRDGSTEDLAAFTSRNARSRAEFAAAKALSKGAKEIAAATA
jgi:hypothetical protein